MIRITAKYDGFRRAGMAHFGTRGYPDGAFSPEELARLQSESMLIVEVIPESKKAKEPAPVPGVSNIPETAGAPEKS